MYAIAQNWIGAFSLCGIVAQIQYICQILVAVTLFNLKLNYFSCEKKIAKRCQCQMFEIIFELKQSGNQNSILYCCVISAVSTLG